MPTISQLPSSTQSGGAPYGAKTFPVPLRLPSLPVPLPLPHAVAARPLAPSANSAARERRPTARTRGLGIERNASSSFPAQNGHAGSLTRTWREQHGHGRSGDAIGLALSEQSTGRPEGAVFPQFLRQRVCQGAPPMTRGATASKSAPSGGVLAVTSGSSRGRKSRFLKRRLPQPSPSLHLRRPRTSQTGRLARDTARPGRFCPDVVVVLGKKSARATLATSAGLTGRVVPMGRRIAQAMTAALLAALPMACGGASPPPPADSVGCAEDTDCKGTRICVSGVCTDADASSGGSSDASTPPLHTPTETGADASDEASNAGTQTVGEQCTTIVTAFCTQVSGPCAVGVILADCIARDMPMCCTGSACNAVSRSSGATVSACTDQRDQPEPEQSRLLGPTPGVAG